MFAVVESWVTGGVYAVYVRPNFDNAVEMALKIYGEQFTGNQPEDTRQKAMEMARYKLVRGGELCGDGEGLISIVRISER